MHNQKNNNQPSDSPEDNELLIHVEKPSWFQRIIREVLEFIADVALNTLIIIGIIIIIRFVIISPFEVNGSSMVPTLHNKEYIIVNKLTYRFHDPKRGDIIVLVPAQNPATFYVKRIIGLPGEKIEFSHGDVIIHNDEFPAGKRLEEDYINTDGTYLPNGADRTISIPQDHYFVMGDNRGASNDSRMWLYNPKVLKLNKSGTLHRQNIIGRVWLRVLPFKKFGFFPHRSYYPELDNTTDQRLQSH